MATATMLCIFNTEALAKDVPTSCQDVCDILTSTSCVVSTSHDVVAGSQIDCSSDRDITISSGALRVHDGLFTLHGKSIVLSAGGQVIADCPQSFSPTGFALRADGDMSIAAGSQGKLVATCGVEGGGIVVEASGDVTIRGLGIDADGSAADAPGGSVRLDAGGTVTILADVSAEATSGVAGGGHIHLRGDAVIVQAELRAKGYGGTGGEMSGGDIVIDASGDATINAGPGLNASTAKGGGGSIRIDAGGLVDVSRPIKALGTSGSLGSGGNIDISGDEVRINNSVTATGGANGGGIDIDAQAAGITIGTAAGATIDVSGGNRAAGIIRVSAHGGPVTLGSGAVLRANGGSGAQGGQIALAGVDLTTSGSGQVTANGASRSEGGAVEIIGRGTMTLAGTIDAEPLGGKRFIYKDVAPSVAGNIVNYQLVHMPEL